MSDALCEQLEPSALAGRDVSRRFVKEIPISFARRFVLIGLEESGYTMTVAMPTLERLPVAEQAGIKMGLSIEPVLAPERAILDRINTAYSEQEAGVELVIDSLGASGDVGSLGGVTTDDLLDDVDRAPVIKLVNAILFEAVKRRASDVHVQPLADGVQVRFRIDGVLYDHVRLPPRLLDETVSRIKVIARMNIAEKRLAQDGRTTVSIGDRMIDLRVSTLPTSHGERVVLRLLDKSARKYDLAELGMSDRDLKAFRTLIRRPYGIFLVTGPTGSGKSTTLYAALQELNSTELNIVTLEDPIEYQLPGISQTQVSTKKGMTFATGLRTVLRQDPDVVMVGEIRDEETARMAVQSSLTGHLVFSTLHTNDAAGAVARLLDLGIEPYLVASSLIGVMAQRLLRRNCRSCKQERAVSTEERLQLMLDRDAPLAVWDGKGCEQCLQTGYFDRTGVFELFVVNEEVRSLIVQRRESRDIKQAAQRSGMHTLRQDAMRKLFEGKTTVEEVLRLTHDEEWNE